MLVECRVVGVCLFVNENMILFVYAVLCFLQIGIVLCLLDYATQRRAIVLLSDDYVQIIIDFNCANNASVNCPMMLHVPIVIRFNNRIYLNTCAELRFYLL